MINAFVFTDILRYIRNMKDKTSIFIEKAQKVHGDKYDYSKTIYSDSKSRVVIICKEHGEFQQFPYNHLNGGNCTKCSGKYKPTTDEFIEECENIHKGKYDYSKAIYKNKHTKVCIICPIHGEFEQMADDHMRGRGCIRCGHIDKSEKLKSEKTHFIDKAKKVHFERYDYSKVKYDTMKKKVQIVCKTHGVFSQTPSNHLYGQGCPKCTNKISKPELELQKFIRSLGLDIQTNSKKIISPLELDIYIPSLKKAIEFNGTYWHYSDKYFVPGKHAQKSKMCKDNEINLLYVREDLWNKDKEKMKHIVEKFIKYEKLSM